MVTADAAVRTDRREGRNSYVDNWLFCAVKVAIFDSNVSIIREKYI